MLICRKDKAQTTGKRGQKVNDMQQSCMSLRKGALQDELVAAGMVRGHLIQLILERKKQTNKHTKIFKSEVEGASSP